MSESKLDRATVLARLRELANRGLNEPMPEWITGMGIGTTFEVA